jgi:hypothetical protein
MKRTAILSTVLAASILFLLTLGLRAQGHGPQAGAPGTLPERRVGQAGPSANLGTVFTYQGRLLDNGTPLDDSCDFRFSLYDDLAAGSLVAGPLDVLGTTVTDGRFTVELDFGAVFDGTALWLEVAVQCTGDAGYTTLDPRQPLNAAPYALYALETADHDHLGQTWTGLNNPLVITGTFNASPRAPLVLGNGGGYGLYVESPGEDGMFVYAPGDDGVYVSGAGDDGVYVANATDDGVNVFSPDGDGLQVYQAGQYGVYVNNSTDDGVYVESPGSDGLYVNGAAGYGVVVDRPILGGILVDHADGHGVNVNVTTDYGDGLHVFQAGGAGVHVSQTGGEGVFIGYSSLDGLYVFQPGDYAAWFDGDIYVSGSCVGCALVYVGLNDGGEPLENGDLVAVSGVNSPLLGTTTPVMRVRRAGVEGAGAVIGVVQGKAEVTRRDGDGQQLERADWVDGVAAPGEHVFIVVQGITYVKADSTAGDIAAGQRLTAADQPGHVRALQTRTLEGMVVTEGAPVLGIALGPLDKDTGLIPVLVTLR